MIYAVLFACALTAGWAAAWKSGGAAERETMCLLTLIWVGSGISNWATGLAAPTLFYAALDIFAVGWLLYHQRRNWQWIPAGLFASMMLTHFVFWSGTNGGLIIEASRPYQDILAVLAYAQIVSVGWACHERARERAGQPSRLGGWALATGWVFVRRLGNGNHARS
jgi:hypothetical protein